jgi:hypothetical protein
VISKVLAADAVIWLDVVQYSKGSWTNRQKLPDSSWLTVPVAHGSSFAPINKVRIGKPLGDWRSYMVEQLIRVWPSPATTDVCNHIDRGYPLLVGLNAAILQVVLDYREYEGEQHWQSHLDAAHALVAVSEQQYQLAPISERIAEMVYSLGGHVYLSGPSGWHYLDERPFTERGVLVEYWQHEGPNPCCLERLAKETTV